MAVFQLGGLVEQVAVTATAAGTTTLVNNSKQIQIFTGTTTQTVVLPNATTMIVGQKYEIFNQSTGALTLQFNGGAAFTDAYGTNYSGISAHTSLFIVLQTNSTSAGTWAVLSSSAGGGANFPTVQKFLSGSGTYTTPSNVLFIEVEVVGGGGGGGGSGTGSSGGTGGTGISSTFGPTGNTGMLTANGGVGGIGYIAGTGGTISLSSPAIQVIALQGGSASGAQYQLSNASGTSGGVSPFGGAGEGAPAGSNSGGAAIANSGSGGGGGATVATASAGAGGGAGGYIKAIINNPVSSYSYSVGSGGSGGAGGTSGYSGGNGGSGAIIVTEYYANGSVGTATSITGSLSTANCTAPTVQKFLSGSGTYTLPTSPRTPLYIRVTAIGGGGGGGGSETTGTQNAGTGGTGGTSTFGTSLLTANGGVGGGVGTGGGGAGGTATITTSSTVIQIAAVQGGSGQGIGNATTGQPGGAGAASPFGGQGGSQAGGSSGLPGFAAITNTGSGGGGASNGSTAGYAGSGGGAGGYLQAVITSPSATYSYSVGTAGTAGTAGTSMSAGGAGGSGVIIVEEFYQ